MSNLLLQVKIFWDTYPIDAILLILSLLGNLILLIKANKNLQFMGKVKHTRCSVQAVIKSSVDISTISLKKKLSNFFKGDFRLISDDGGAFIFKSLKTDNIYHLTLAESVDGGPKNIILKNENAFRINKIGVICGLKQSMKEVQEVINLFSEEKQKTERIHTYIKICPRSKEELIKENIEIKESNNERSFTCTKNMITVTVVGVPKIEDNVKEALKKWLKYFV
jgi:hypothetical protein